MYMPGFLRTASSPLSWLNFVRVIFAVRNLIRRHIFSSIESEFSFLHKVKFSDAHFAHQISV